MLARHVAMIRSLLAATLLATAAALPAQVSPREVDRLRDAALADNYAWDITEGLTTEVGQRMAGTEAEARARAWSVVKLTAMGFANVRIDPFTMPVWVRGAESAAILAPFPQKLVIAALGNSGSTPPGSSSPRVPRSTASTSASASM